MITYSTQEVVKILEGLKQNLGVDVDSYGAIPAERVRAVIDELIKNLGAKGAEGN